MANLDTDHQRYEPIADVVTFDAAGLGPYCDTLAVMANVGASTNYPTCRITVGVGDLGAIGLTLEQSRSLRATLEAAERDVAAGCPSLENGTAVSGG